MQTHTKTNKHKPRKHGFFLQQKYDIILTRGLCTMQFILQKAQMAAQVNYYQVDQNITFNIFSNMNNIKFPE